MTYTAMEIHKDLVQEGFDVESDDYYNEINQRIRSEFPHKFEEKTKAEAKSCLSY